MTDIGLTVGRRLGASLPVEDGRGWYAKGYDSNIAATLRIVIHCLPSEVVGRYVIRTATLADDDASRSGYVGCGQGRRAVTGGVAWRSPGQAPSPAVDQRIDPSAPTLDAKRWNGAGVSTDTSRELVLVGLCRPR